MVGCTKPWSRFEFKNDHFPVSRDRNWIKIRNYRYLDLQAHAWDAKATSFRQWNTILNAWQFSLMPGQFSNEWNKLITLSASHQEQHPRIISGPSHPMIGKKQGNLTFDWTFRLLPGRTWIESVEDVAFGFWKAPGYLKTKLIAIGKNGEVMIRQNHESKISCTFNMSLLQVAFTVHNLSAGDENEYGLHVELGLARKPLIDVVTLLLEGNIINSITSLKHIHCFLIRISASAVKTCRIFPVFFFLLFVHGMP